MTRFVRSRGVVFDRGRRAFAPRGWTGLGLLLDGIQLVEQTVDAIEARAQAIESAPQTVVRRDHRAIIGPQWGGFGEVEAVLRGVYLTLSGDALFPLSGCFMSP